MASEKLASAAVSDGRHSSGKQSRIKTAVSLMGSNPLWMAIIPLRYRPKNTSETESIRARAPRAPNAVQIRHSFCHQNSPNPPTDAAENFQITPSMGPIPSPTGWPAYQKPGHIIRKCEAVQAKAIPDGPHRRVSKNRLAAHTNSSKPQRNHLSGRSIER